MEPWSHTTFFPGTSILEQAIFLLLFKKRKYFHDWWQFKYPSGFGQSFPLELRKTSWGIQEITHFNTKHVTRWFSKESDSISKGHWTMSGDSLAVHAGARRCCQVPYSQLVGRGQQCYWNPTVHQTPHTTKNYPASNVDSTKGENPDLDACSSERCLLPGRCGLPLGAC